MIQGQIALSGISMDIAVDTADNLAIVASGPGGVNIVDVSNPSNPVLKQTIKLPSGAQAVMYFDGLAYVATGASINSIDPLTGEIQDGSSSAAARSQDSLARGRSSIRWIHKITSARSTSVVSA